MLGSSLLVFPDHFMKELFEGGDPICHEMQILEEEPTAILGTFDDKLCHFFSNITSQGQVLDGDIWLLDLQL